jgi:hypothetical protein
MREAVLPAVQQWVLGAVGAAFGAIVLIAIVVESRAQPASSGDETLVLAADESLGAAMRAGDKSIARKILSLQFSFVDEDGKLYDRKNFLGSLKDVAAAPSGDAKATIYGRIGVVTGHRKSVHNNEVFFLDIWARQKGAWRALVAQDVMLATSDSAPAVDEDKRRALENELRELGKSFDCHNPCDTIPYRVRSPAEQEIVNAFQAIEKAIFVRDTAEYAKHIADGFVHYESNDPPVPKSERIAAFEERKQKNIPAVMTAVQSMRLWVYDDGAAMVSVNGAPNGTEPLARFARVWVKRDGQWQMAISVQTDVKSP